MRICIFGAGATGGHLAVKLARGGHDVSVVVRGAHLEAIKTRGLRLIAGENDWTAPVKASSEPAELGVQDLVLVTVKATGLAAVADALKPLVATDTAVIFAQNGVPWWYPLGLGDDKPTPPKLAHFALAERFLDSLNAGQIIGGTLFSGNAVEAPGVIHSDSPNNNRLTIGPVTPGSHMDMGALRTVFRDIGFTSIDLDADIRDYVWSKLVFNMSGSTLALATGNETSVCRTDPALETIYRRITAEGLKITAAHGFDLSAKTDVDATLARIPHHKPSLLQDYEAGRPLEIAHIVHAPQAFARAAGIETPTLDAISAIVSRLASDRGLA